MTSYTKANKFIVAEGEAGELYIVMESQKAAPQSPKIVYDGGDHAIFVRSPEQSIILDYIHPDIRPQLRKVREVMVIETILDNIKSNYHVTMNIVDKIPLDWSKIGLKTWEQAALGKA